MTRASSSHHTRDPIIVFNKDVGCFSPFCAPAPRLSNRACEAHISLVSTRPPRLCAFPPPSVSRPTPSFHSTGVWAQRSSLGPGQMRLLRHVRLALGLPAVAAPHADHKDDGRKVITSKDLRLAMARLDPHGSGRLPLGKIKAALQCFGLRVGNVPHASWLDLTGR